MKIKVKIDLEECTNGFLNKLSFTFNVKLYIDDKLIFDVYNYDLNHETAFSKLEAFGDKKDKIGQYVSDCIHKTIKKIYFLDDYETEIKEE